MNTPPFINDPTVYNETDDVTLTCEHNGRPNPIAIRWQGNNVAISDLQLTIDSIQRSDAGIYICCLDRVIAGNLDITCDNFTITVQCKYSMTNTLLCASRAASHIL